MRSFVVAGSTLLLTVTTACAGSPTSSPAAQCENGLKVAYRELDFAKAKGFGGTVELSKAATLLTGAKIQQEFGKYPNCIDKVRRARSYIIKSRQQPK